MDKPPAPQAYPASAPLLPPRLSLPRASKDVARDFRRMRASLCLRRLRYFIDLMREGYERALRPNPMSRCLRAERIALGVDLPELDTVPLWSTRRENGTVCIPFIEFILAQVWDCLQTLSVECEDAPADDVEVLGESQRALARLMMDLDAGGDWTSSLPRLHDLYVPEGPIGELCGGDGLLQRIAAQCETVVEQEVAELLGRGASCA